LKPGGHVLILGPNFRYCYREYYDYFDHHLALTEKAIVEALHLAGFVVEKAIPRTLPFTFRSRLPSWPWLVWVYVRCPWLWRLFGAQFFVVGRTRACSAESPQSTRIDRPHNMRSEGATNARGQ
jgi:hypothetical protein